MLSPNTTNFMGYTFKNFDLVNDHQIPELGASEYPFFSLFFSFIICEILMDFSLNLMSS